ncbi:MAG: nucleotidyltransferase family protein [Clostridiales bacterium]|nr:nucleotidyltransferase family protein [Clostridiales bacterium]
MIYSSTESEYLIALLRSAIKGTTPPKPPEGIDWQALVEKSKAQQIYSVIAPVIDLNLLPGDIAQQFKLYSQNELLRMIAMKNELDEIEKELKNKHIKFMLLKGSVIRNYYPQQKMRQMSDYDILYDYSKKDELLNIMNDRGYRLASWSENSDDFNKKPFYTFEFHRELFFSEHDFCPDFSDVWENAEQDKKNPYLYHMSREDLYLHAVSHMYKHYILDGFGIRFLTDVYVMLEAFGDEFDKEYIKNKLAKIELTRFEKTARELTYSIFNEKEFTAEQEKFLDNVMAFGVYGSGENGPIYYYEEYVKKSGRESILGYFISKTFPDFSFMKRTYGILNDKPYLLPYYYIKRIFGKFKHERNHIASQIKSLSKMKNDNKNK